MAFLYSVQFKLFSWVVLAELRLMCFPTLIFNWTLCTSFHVLKINEMQIYGSFIQIPYVDFRSYRVPETWVWLMQWNVPNGRLSLDSKYWSAFFKNFLLVLQSSQKHMSTRYIGFCVPLNTVTDNNCVCNSRMGKLIAVSVGLSFCYFCPFSILSLVWALFYK